MLSLNNIFLDPWKVCQVHLTLGISQPGVMEASNARVELHPAHVIVALQPGLPVSWWTWDVIPGKPWGSAMESLPASIWFADMGRGRRW
jgi:hypothetical protein